MITALEWALDYALIGMPVFPCAPATKGPLTRHGFKEASCDPERITSWWTKHPNAMIGCPTGLVTHAFVLDINPPAWMGNGGALKAIQDATGNPKATETLTVQTPNGLHLWYLMPTDVVIRNRGEILAGAIDCVRGEGGYVIMPGSVNAEGKSYSYLTGPNQPKQQKFACKSLIDIVRPR